MKTLTRALLILAALYSTVVLAENQASDNIQIENPFARATAPGMMMGGAFMTLRNNGDKEYLLINATSDAAKHVELHTHIKENGMMRMRRMAHFHLKPAQTRVLKPGSLHIMLMGIHKPLQEGGQITIGLEFDDGSSTSVNVPVKSISALH